MEKVDYSIEYAHIYSDQLKANQMMDEHIKSIERTKQIIGLLNSLGKSYSLSVLIDNYNEGEFENEEVDFDVIYSELDKYGLPPDHIMCESNLTHTADLLIDNISNRYLKAEGTNKIVFTPTSNYSSRWAPSNNDYSFRRQFWDYSQGKIDDISSMKILERSAASIDRESFLSKSEIVLKYVYDQNTNKTYYTCPLLTACWHLTRLGVNQFDVNASKIKSFTSKPFFADKLITVLPSKYLKVEGTAMEIISLAKKKSIKKSKKNIEYVFF